MPQHCPDGNIRIAPSGEKITVRFAGRVIVETMDALDLVEQGYPVRVYVPASAVDQAVLRSSAHHTTCPYKGVASYYDLSADGVTAPRAVWYYPDPCSQVAAIKDRVAFWGDQVEVVRG